MQRQRRDALAARRSMSRDERDDASRVICQHVIASREFGAAATIGCFLPMPDEVDTREIIARAWRANKRVFVPVLRGGREMLFCAMHRDTELERDSFGIWEPSRGLLCDPRMIDLVITPTVAFDGGNNRIGMGSAYYDRCFAFLRHRRHWLKPKLIGVAFECQKVEKISPNPWDIPLYRIVTERT